MKNKLFTQNLITREDIPTGLSYELLTIAFKHEMGKFDPIITNSLIQKKAPWKNMKDTFQSMAGTHGLMIFSQVNQGQIISLHNGIKLCSLYLVGNPLIADQILSIDIRASLYVPFRVCIYDNENPGGAIIGFDRPSSSLATLQQPGLKEIGNLLDSKIDSVVQAIIKNYK